MRQLARLPPAPSQPQSTLPRSSPTQWVSVACVATCTPAKRAVKTDRRTIVICRPRPRRCRGAVACRPTAALDSFLMHGAIELDARLCAPPMGECWPKRLCVAVPSLTHDALASCPSVCQTLDSDCRAGRPRLSLLHPAVHRSSSTFSNSSICSPRRRSYAPTPSPPTLTQPQLNLLALPQPYRTTLYPLQSTPQPTAPSPQFKTNTLIIPENPANQPATRDTTPSYTKPSASPCKRPLAVSALDRIEAPRTVYLTATRPAKGR